MKEIPGKSILVRVSDGSSYQESTAMTLKGSLLRVDSLSFVNLINKLHRHSPCSHGGSPWTGGQCFVHHPGYKHPFFTFLEMQL